MAFAPAPSRFMRHALAAGAIIASVSCTGSGTPGSASQTTGTIPTTSLVALPTTADDGASPRSTVASTTSTSTVLLPETGSITVAALASAAEPGQLDQAADLLVLGGNTPVVLIAGSSSTGPGSPLHAVVYGFDSTEEWLDTVSLDDAGAIESRLYGIDATGDAVAVTGVVVGADGVPRAALWRSADRGVTFGSAEFIVEGPGFGVDVVFVDGSLTVILRRPRPGQVGSYELATALDGPDGWTITPLPTAGTDPLVSGVVASGPTMIIAGSSDRGDRTLGTVWLSTDDAGSFVEADDAVLAARTNIGAPVVGGDGFIATASSPSTEPTVLVTSADGSTWRTIDLSVTGLNSRPKSLSDAGSFGLAPIDNGYAVGLKDLLASVATVDQGGRGQSDFAGIPDDDLFIASSPFVFAGGLFSLSTSRSTFRIVEQVDNLPWIPLAPPPGAGSGPIADTARLHPTSAGPRALSTSFPHVTRGFDGSVRWTPERRWNSVAGGSWVASGDDFPDDTSLVSANGTVELAVLRGADDPADDGNDGSSGGTSAAYRPIGDSEWTVPELILSGPGGDALVDVTPTATGFIGVGYHDVRDASGVESWSPVAIEYVDQAWAEQQIDLDLGDRADLSRVVVSESGVVVASGEVEQNGVQLPLLLTRDGVGAWDHAGIDIAPIDVQIYDLAAGPEGITVLTLEGDDWFRHRTLDGSTFTKQLMSFDIPLDSFPEFVAEVGGRTVVVGTIWTLGVSALTVWEVAGDGSTTPIELDTTPFGLDLSVEDVLVDDNVLLVSGVADAENRVWTIQLPG